MPMLLFLGSVFLVLVTVAVVGFMVVRPRMLHWGASSGEALRAMAGDDLIRDPVLATTRAVSIEVEPDRVWPWLAQIGQGRGGFYSYEWLENLIGLDIHNSDRIIPEMQDLHPGDLVPFWRGAGVRVVKIEPGRLLVLAGTLNSAGGMDSGAEPAGGTWVFGLSATPNGSSRLVVRSRVAGFPPAWLSVISMRALEPLHFIMEQKMLRGIRRRAQGT